MTQLRNGGSAEGTVFMSHTICETGGGNDGDGNELGYGVGVEETVSDEYH
jgi:hypothetical protein